MGSARQVVEGLLPCFLEVCKVRFSPKLSLSLFAIFFVQRAIFVNEKGDIFFAMIKKGLQATQIERQRDSADEGLDDEGRVWVEGFAHLLSNQACTSLTIFSID
jgi:hypothetical protein